VGFGSLLREARLSAGLTLDELAQRAGTSAPTLSNYERGRKEPRLETAQRIVRASGFELQVAITPVGLARPLTRKDRQSLALHRAVAVRLFDDPDEVLATADRNLRRLQEVHGDGPSAPYVDAWAALLAGPRDDLFDVLTATSQRARDLRQTSPFAGVLDPDDRERVLAAVR
jgi:transcriptional regulator with XRE-family HTH domain